MASSSRLKAFAAYLFLAVGGIVVLLMSNNDRYSAFHARQSIALTAVMVLGPLVWAPIGYLIAFIPFAGPLLASASFALVIGFLMAMIVVWIIGMVRALRADAEPLPFVGGLAIKWLGA